MKTTLQVDDVLLKEFQKVVFERFGKLKGTQSEALVEAIKLWLAFRGRRRFFAVAGSHWAEVMELAEVQRVLSDILSSGSVSFNETVVFPLFDSFDRDELKDIVKVAENILGEPLEVSGSIEGLEHDDDLAIFTWRLEEGKAGYSLKFVMRARLGSLGFSRAWSKTVTGIKDLLEKATEQDLGYDVRRGELSVQPTLGQLGGAKRR